MRCPVCGGAVSGGPAMVCTHVVAWMGRNGFTSPLDGVALPWLAGAATRRRWPARTVAETFGDLAPLIDAYGAVADWRPGLSARVLWPLLAEYIDEPVVKAERGEDEEDDAAETYWCAADPERVGRAARAIAALLRQGYACLSERGEGAAGAVEPKIA